VPSNTSPPNFVAVLSKTDHTHGVDCQSSPNVDRGPHSSLIGFLAQRFLDLLSEQHHSTFIGLGCCVFFGLLFPLSSPTRSKANSRNDDNDLRSAVALAINLAFNCGVTRIAIIAERLGIAPQKIKPQHKWLGFNNVKQPQTCSKCFVSVEFVALWSFGTMLHSPLPFVIAGVMND